MCIRDSVMIDPTTSCSTCHDRPHDISRRFGATARPLWVISSHWEVFPEVCCPRMPALPPGVLSSILSACSQDSFMRMSFCHRVHAFLGCSECRERACRESADKTLERALGFPVSTVPVGAPVLLPASWNEPRQGSEFTKQWNFDFHLVRLGN